MKRPIGTNCVLLKFQRMHSRPLHVRDTWKTSCLVCSSMGSSYQNRSFCPLSDPAMVSSMVWKTPLEGKLRANLRSVGATKVVILLLPACKISAQRCIDGAHWVAVTLSSPPIKLSVSACPDALSAGYAIPNQCQVIFISPNSSVRLRLTPRIPRFGLVGWSISDVP